MNVSPRGRHDPRFVGQVAEKCLKDNDFQSLPIRPKHIAEHLDIMVQAKPDTTPGVSGMLLRHDTSFAILYATHIPSEGFQNFSIAHELGHYLIEGHPEILFAKGKTAHESRAGFISSDPLEQEADHFAAGLLMPDFLFVPAIRGMDDGLKAIEKLAGLCETSLTATAIRYVVAFDDKFLVWHAAIRIARILRPQPVEEEHIEPAVMLGFDGASRLQFE
jgi:IrrE N-terminal-like domain